MPVLGLIELIFIGVFFLLMVIGTALDRRYNESPKWWILGIGLAVAVVYFWGQTDFTTIWTAVQSWSFWKPLGTYLVAGLIYSVLEFILSVRKMARSHAESWNRFIGTVETTYFLKEGEDGPLASKAGEQVDGQWVKEKDGKYFIRVSDRGIFGRNGEVEKEVEMRKVVYRDIFKKAQEVGATDADKERAAKLLNAYLHRDEYRLSDLKKDFVQVELNAGTQEVQPVVNRARLSAFIGAWTFLWPAYAVSLILGDFVVEVFRVIGDAFSKLGGRFVKLTFADTFKV